MVSTKKQSHRRRNTLIGLGVGAGGGPALGDGLANHVENSIFGARPCHYGLIRWGRVPSWEFLQRGHS
jgi:hypothetical protein